MRESVFVNWTVGGVEVSTEATYTYTMPKAAATIVANFNSEGIIVQSNKGGEV